MADDFLPPLVARLVGDISDYVEKTRDAKRVTDEFVAHENTALNSIKDVDIKVTIEADNLRAEVTRAAAAAEAGQKINIPVDADTSHVGPGVSERLRDERGRFVAAGEGAGDALGEGIYRGTDGRLRGADGRFVEDGERIGRSMGGGAGRGFSSEFSKMNLGSTGMFSNLVPFIIPAIAAVGALSGALALVPALAFAAGSSLAAIAVGASGVSGAIKAYGQEQAAAGAGAGQSAAQQMAAANSIISAQEGVRNAIRAVEDAQRSAANSIISAQQAVTTAVRAAANAQTAAANSIRSALQAQQRAEEALQSAQVSALRAQQNLTDARMAATRSLEDMQSRVTDDALAQRAAVAAVEDAQRALQATQSNSYASSQQVSAAQLAYDQAVQQLHNTSVAYDRSKVDAAAAAAAGVEGSKQVVTAQDQVLGSQKALRAASTAVEDATQRVTDAQVSGAEQVQAANQRVADTQRALAEAQIDGAERIQRAQEGVITAQRNLAQAIASAADSAAGGAAAVNKFNDAMAKLSPNAQAFVREVIALGPAWTALRLDVQERLFAGLAGQLHQLGAVALPVLHTGLAKMATSINENITEFTKWAVSAKTVADMDRIFDNSAVAAHNLAAAVRPVQDILRDVTLVASEFLPGMATGFANAAQHAADFIRNARDTGKLREWIQTGIDAVKKLWGIFTDLIAIIADVSAAPGPDLLDFIKAVTGGMRWLIENVPGLIPILEAVFVAWKLAQIAQGIGNVIDGIKKLIPQQEAAGVSAEAAGKKMSGAWKSAGVAVGAYVVGLALLKAGEDNAGDGFKDMSKDAADTAGKLLTLDFGGVVDKIGRDIDRLPADMKTAGDRWGWALDGIKDATTGFGHFMNTTLPETVSSGIDAAIGSFSDFGRGARDAMRDMGGIASDAWGYMVGLGDSVSRGIDWVLGFFRNLGGWIRDGIGDLRGILWDAGAAAMRGLYDGFLYVWNDVKDWLSNVGDWIANLKGPLEKDRQLLIPHGKAIMEGLGEGLENRGEQVLAWVARYGTQLQTAAGGGSLSPRLAVTGGGTRSPGGPAAAGVHITVHVAGSVLSENDLAQVVRQQFLRHGIRNTSNGASYSFG